MVEFLMGIGPASMKAELIRQSLHKGILVENRAARI